METLTAKHTMTKSITRPSRIVNGKRIRSRMYRLAYRLPGMPKTKFVSLHTSDKQVAQKRAEEFLRELQQEKAGIIAPRAQRDAAQVPFLRHVEDYAADLSAAGRDGEYVYTIGKRLAKLAKECGWEWLADVTADSFQNWRKVQTLAAKTLKEYHAAMSAFFVWLNDCGRFVGDPLKGVTPMETRGREVRKRRAFTYEELNRLLSVSGVRAFGYLMAFFTALRRAELDALTWGDVYLDAEKPYVLVRASTTKNHKAAEIRLHAQLVRELIKHRPAGASGSDPLLQREQIADMDMMRKDLKAAGIEFEIQGRRVDFHSLRGSLNTHLAIAEVDPQVRQKLMRHSEIKLTLDHYTDSTMLPLTEAVTKLPEFTSYATPCATVSDISCPQASSPGTNGKNGDASKDAAHECVGHETAPSGASCHEPQNGWPTRIRT